MQQFHSKDLSDNYQGNRYSFQDTNLRYHWTLWTLASDNNEQNKTFGLAIIPQITLPTGKEDFYLSDKSFPGYGLEISAEKRLNSFHLVGNVGIHFSPKAVLMNMDRRRMILTALGAYVPLSHDRSWATTLEWRRNWTRVSDYNPTEIHLSLQKTWNTSLTGFASLGTSDPRHILHGVNGNNFRVLAGLKYQPSTTLAENTPSMADSTTTPLAETALLPTTPSTTSSGTCCVAKRDFTIYFDIDHSYIRTKESKILDQAIASYRQLEHASILIISHTDERASVVYNQKLSEKRSEEVARYFLSQGIPASAIEKISLGKHQLKLIHAQHENDHEKNRRSEIHIIHHLENDSSSLTQECQP